MKGILDIHVMDVYLTNTRSGTWLFDTGSVANIRNRTSIKYPGVTATSSKVHINNMYITYTFVHLAILLIRQILGAVPLLVTSLFAVEALSLRLRSRLGFLLLSSNLFVVLLEVPLLLPFTVFLETGGLVDHQHLMLLLDFYLRSLKHREELGNCLFRPLHIIVHHEAFIAWWQ